MYQTILIIYMLVAIVMIIFVLMQESKDGGMGGLGGGSAANTVFGSSGSGNFMTRLTTILAIIFFGLCIVIGNFNTKQTRAKSSGNFDDLTQDAQVLEVPKTEVPKAGPLDAKKETPKVIDLPD